jgi:phospho-N-acetylmuramoyl-pentapeptide-transferase
LLYHLLYQLHTTYSGFNVFRYITFRAAMAALMSLLVSFLLGPSLIRSLTAKQIGQQIREDGPASHSTKAGTPTMGGVLIILALSLSTIISNSLGRTAKGCRRAPSSPGNSPLR